MILALAISTHCYFNGISKSLY